MGGWQQGRGRGRWVAIRFVFSVRGSVEVENLQAHAFIDLSFDGCFYSRSRRGEVNGVFTGSVGRVGGVEVLASFAKKGILFQQGVSLFRGGDGGVEVLVVHLKQVHSGKRGRVKSWGFFTFFG